MGGTAFVFVPLLALGMISLYIVAVFASHYFLTLVECTAHGQRQVQWPSEAFLEWVTKPLHLGWMAGLYLLPAVLLSAGAARVSPYLAIAAWSLAFAMLFPIGALSAFIANSVWTPFHPKAIALLLMKPALTLGFYFIGVTARVVGLGGVFLAIFSKELGWGGAIVGGLLASFAWFAYACSLGRLLFAVTYTAPPPRKRRKKKKAEGGGRKAEGEKTGPPSAVPPPPSEEKEIPFWERPKPSWDPDRDETPYAAQDAEVVTKLAHPDIAKPKESEMKLLDHEPPPPPPTNPFGFEAFAAFGQSETMRNAIVLGIMLAIQSGLVRALIDLNPMK
jgi:hypothetical protein